MNYSIGILTISDRASSGEYQDKSGPFIAEIITRRLGWTIREQQTIKDEINPIIDCLINWCDEGIDLILTTGGTGFAPRDVTPEATQQVIQKLAPGIAEALRSDSLKITPHAMLSRGIAGIRSKTLIINLPGSPKAVKENLDVLIPVLPHALNLITETGNAEKDHRLV